MKKIFKEIEGYNGRYLVNNLGEIFSISSKGNKKKIKPYLNMQGYYRVKLYNKEHIPKQYLVHRLVANAFLDRLDGQAEINHKDSNKLNNKLSNLEWVSHSQNMYHYWKHKKAQKNKKK